MLWYNTETNIIQENNPAGQIVSNKYMKENYPEWVQVKDNFVPKMDDNLMIEQKISEIEEKYLPILDKYKNAMISAQILNKDTTSIQEAYKEVFDEYIAKRKEALNNG